MVGEQVVNSLVNDGVSEQMVVDSTTAPNYKAWQTNIGEGNQVMNTMTKFYTFQTDFVRLFFSSGRRMFSWIFTILT